MRPLLLCLLSLFLLYNILKAQKNTEKRNYYTIYVNYPDYTVRAAIRKKPATFKANTERPYFWYAANQINSTQGGYDGKLLHGNYAAFYLNNNLKEKGRFEKGLKEGKWNTWHADGKLGEVAHYSKGLRSGKYESYDLKGRPVVKATFKNGKFHGKSETYLNGELSAVRYYRDGEEYTPKEKKRLFKLRDTQHKSRDASRDNNTRNEKQPADSSQPDTVKEKKVRKKKETGNPKLRDASRDNNTRNEKQPADSSQPDTAKEKKVRKKKETGNPKLRDASRDNNTQNEKQPVKEKKPRKKKEPRQHKSRDTQHKSHDASRDNKQKAVTDSSN